MKKGKMNQKWKLRITAYLLAFIMCLPLAEFQTVAWAATARKAEAVVTWKSNFGGSGSDTYNAVAVVEEGYVAVGSSYLASFGAGDWAEVKSNDDPEDRWAEGKKRTFQCSHFQEVSKCG